MILWFCCSIKCSVLSFLCWISFNDLGTRGRCTTLRAVPSSAPDSSELDDVVSTASDSTSASDSRSITMPLPTKDQDASDCSILIDTASGGAEVATSAKGSAAAGSSRTSALLTSPPSAAAGSSTTSALLISLSSPNHKLGSYENSL